MPLRIIGNLKRVLETKMFRKLGSAPQLGKQNLKTERLPYAVGQIAWSQCEWHLLRPAQRIGWELLSRDLIPSAFLIYCLLEYKKPLTKQKAEGQEK